MDNFLAQLLLAAHIQSLLDTVALPGDILTLHNTSDELGINRGEYNSLILNIARETDGLFVIHTAPGVLALNCTYGML